MTGAFEPGGWDPDREDRDALNALPDDNELVAMHGEVREVSFNPRKVIRVEDQSSQGACAGHSSSSVAEWVKTIVTGEVGWQGSRAWMYYEAQRRDGINGDRGSTINGGKDVLMEWGIPDESMWPYPRTYDNRRPHNFDQVKLNAAQNKIGSAVRVSSYEGGSAFIGTAQGGIHLGITWNDSVNRGIVESYSSSGGSGHALAGLCLSDRVDKAGDHYWWILNSWTERFGQDGWAEWSPKAIRQMLDARNTVMIGLSDMPEVKPREFTVKEIRERLTIC